MATMRLLAMWAITSLLWYAVLLVMFHWSEINDWISRSLGGL